MPHQDTYPGDACPEKREVAPMRVASKCRREQNGRTALRRRPTGRLRALLLAAPLAAFAPSGARAAEVAPMVAKQLSVAAEDGPRALLDGLDQVLAANPKLAATPDGAAALARVAAAPVPDFVGANLPVYRAIVERIVGAAPPSQREAVRQAVDQELTRYVANDIRIMPPLAPGSIGNTGLVPPDVGAAGFKLGSFTLYPSVQVASFYDDNIYATRTGKVSDWAGTVSPNLALQSNWARNSLYAEAGADLTGYWSHGSENTADWHTLAEGRIDVAPKTHILIGGLALHEHEDRSSPDAVEGLTPTPYTELDAYAGVTHRIGDFSLHAGDAIERITFGNVMGLHGEINNQDRNRNRYTFGVSARDDANVAFRPYVEAIGDLRRYDRTVDDFSYQRSSDGYRTAVGALFRLMPGVSGEASIGIMGRSYDDPRFKTVTTPAADAYLRWQAGANTAVVVFFDRSIEETTLPGSPAYIYSVLGGRIEQGLLPDLTGFLRVAMARSSFVQVSRMDDEADVSVGLRYRLTRRVELGLDYRYTQRVSGDSSFSFNRNEVFLQLASAF